MLAIIAARFPVVTDWAFTCVWSRKHNVIGALAITSYTCSRRECGQFIAFRTYITRSFLSVSTANTIFCTFISRAYTRCKTVSVCITSLFATTEHAFSCGSIQIFI